MNNLPIPSEPPTPLQPRPDAGLVRPFRFPAQPHAYKVVPLRECPLPADMAQHLARLDADGDGQLTFIEVMIAKEADFKDADKNGDGCIAIDELVVFDRQPAGGSP